MRLFPLPLAVLAGIVFAFPATAFAQRAAGAATGNETYVVDSSGTTVYRNGRVVHRSRDSDVGAGDPLPAPTGAMSPNLPAAPQPAAFTPPPAAPLTLTVAQSETPAAPGKTAGTGLSKEQKAIILNAGVAAAIATYGVIFWDYFQTTPKASSEGWFGRSTSHGGMDKLGHFWTSYSAGHLYSYVYRWWDFDRDTANTLGALSSFGMQTAMELGDSFSGGFGFSYEDEIMNVLGAGAAYVLGRYPELARKIDFRMQYQPERLSDLTHDVFTDYQHQRYLIALKLDGFDMFHESALSYLELHAGYQARGYENGGPLEDRRRSLYFGVGFNVSKFVQNFANIGVFDYVQVPYTSAGGTVGLDR